MIKRKLPALLFSILLGTYLDLLLVGKQMYAFPNRPFSDIFSIHILYLLGGLPILTAIFLLFMEKWNRITVLLICSLIMQLMEQIAEFFGVFQHSSAWSHTNTFFGAVLFLGAVYAFHRWITE
ncbi:CBO0543 family protein [Bacillota bacterium Lsc_1132]